MAEFVVAHILDENPSQKPFTMWPLHVTVVPPFEAPDLESVEQIFEPIITAASPMHMYVGGLATYGNQRKGQVLIPNSQLSVLRQNLIGAAEEHGWKVADKYRGEHYSPHVTSKAGRYFGGTQFILDSLTIVEALPMSYRRIATEIRLDDQEKAA